MNLHLISIEEVVYLLKASSMTQNITGIEDRQSQNVTLCWRDKEKVDCCSRHQTMAGCGTVGAQCPGAPCDIDQWEAGAGCNWPIRRREADNSAAIMILAYFLKRTQLHCCCAQAVRGWGWKDWIAPTGEGQSTEHREGTWAWLEVFRWGVVPEKRWGNVYLPFSQQFWVSRRHTILFCVIKYYCNCCS